MPNFTIKKMKIYKYIFRATRRPEFGHRKNCPIMKAVAVTPLAPLGEMLELDSLLVLRNQPA